MTNYEKQQLKPPASKEPPETANLPKATGITPYKDDGDYVKNAIYQIGETLLKIRTDHQWNNAKLLEWLDTTLFSEPTISRLINHDGKRLPSAAQLFELRRVFGISLDALADGDNPFQIEGLSDEKLFLELEKITIELKRRIRQK